MHILYLVPHIPNPTKIRSHYHIRGLLEAGHRVTVVTVERSRGDDRHIARLQEMGAVVIWTRLTRLKTLLNSLSALPTRLPLQASFMWSDDLMRKIEVYVKTDPPDVVHVEHLRMARYGLRLVKDWPTLWDAVDFLSALYQQAGETGSNWPLRQISRLEAPRLETYERWLTGKFPVTLVISERDQALFQQNNANSSRVRTALLGMPLNALSPASERDDNTLIMTGTLNYHPNVASALYFVHQIFPLIQRQRPQTRLQLAGANPLRSIQALKSDRIEITGFVPSIADYLGRATVALAPVLYGSGVQIKVLEAFLTATPLVATRVALRGLNVRHEEQVLIADTPTDFAACVLRLLDDADLRARIGQAGRRYVEEHHDLVKTTQQLLEIYDEVRRG
jgi:glycosyltransferase involved in cell wall biosynthesis